MDPWTTLMLSRIATGERRREAARYRIARLAVAAARTRRTAR